MTRRPPTSLGDDARGNPVPVSGEHAVISPTAITDLFRTFITQKMASWQVSQRQLAQEFDCNQSTISLMLRGDRHRGELDRWARLAQRFGYRMSELLFLIEQTLQNEQEAERARRRDDTTSSASANPTETVSQSVVAPLTSLQRPVQTPGPVTVPGLLAPPPGPAAPARSSKVSHAHTPSHRATPSRQPPDLGASETVADASRRITQAAIEAAIEYLRQLLPGWEEQTVTELDEAIAGADDGHPPAAAALELPTAPEGDPGGRAALLPDGRRVHRRDARTGS